MGVRGDNKLGNTGELSSKRNLCNRAHGHCAVRRGSPPLAFPGPLPAARYATESGAALRGAPKQCRLLRPAQIPLVSVKVDRRKTGSLATKTRKTISERKHASEAGRRFGRPLSQSDCRPKNLGKFSKPFDEAPGKLRTRASGATTTTACPQKCASKPAVQWRAGCREALRLLRARNSAQTRPHTGVTKSPVAA